MYDTGSGLSEQQVEAFTNSELGVKEGNMGISDITIKASGKYNYNPDTKVFNDPSRPGTNIGGYTTRSPWTGRVSVHISTRATMNPILLKGTLIHEFTHAYHFFKEYDLHYGEKIFRNSTENSAINAERNYYSSFKSISSYARSCIDNCNIYQQQFLSPHPISWDSPFRNFKVITF